LFRKKGIGATNHFEAGGFIRSNETVQYPNLQFHFLPLAIRYDGTAPSEGHGFQLHVGPMGTDVRGHVKIKSSDPLEYPSILFNYLSTPNERKEWCEAVRLSRKILETFCPVVPEEVIVLTISSFNTLIKLKDLNNLTGKNGMSNSELYDEFILPNFCINVLYSTQLFR
jgi:choline dehydrogenase-like flavoprotein